MGQAVMRRIRVQPGTYVKHQRTGKPIRIGGVVEAVAEIDVDQAWFAYRGRPVRCPVKLVEFIVDEA